ncbi:MAG: hypothetical protein KME20_13575 [Kaiparowitsia implicata GSE-PSE-MK54-09C]|jgi:hypothetical protein|nr:hypothetical protein [Kaiparowitsia implicata GSE-PSE-MK54-09C]
MHPKIEAVFDDAENRYLKPEELGVLTQYVDTLPGRLTTYRALRDRELEIMQPVADQLVSELPGEAVATLERCIKNAILVLRSCALGMLLEDEALVQQRLEGWLSQSAQAYSSTAIDTVLYRLLEQQLSQVLGSQQMALFHPMFSLAQRLLTVEEEEPLTAATIGW